MAHSILLVVERPDLSIPENEIKWNACKEKIAKIARQYTNLKVLGENVLLLTLQNSLTALKEALDCLPGMDYKYALFDIDIQWHEVTKDC